MHWNCCKLQGTGVTLVVGKGGAVIVVAAVVDTIGSDIDGSLGLSRIDGHYYCSQSSCWAASPLVFFERNESAIVTLFAKM
jgi:hypothetical protein